MLLAAGTVGVSSALVMGRQLGEASSSLVDVARRVGTETGAATGRALDRRAPQELAQLAHELDVMEQRLDEARLRERTLEASRRELVAWVSHDLRTPLAGMRAIVEAIDDRVVDDPVTIASLLPYPSGGGRSTHRARRRSLRAEPYPSRRAPTAVRAGLARRSRVGRDRGIGADRGREGCQARRTSDRAAARSDGVGSRSAARAAQSARERDPPHAERRKRAWSKPASTTSSREHVYVEVRDTGGGVPEADLPHIFDVAFRSDRARTPGNGSGLGLAIAKGFVEAHNGDLTVVNVNGGARFTLRLPRESV